MRIKIAESHNHERANTTLKAFIWFSINGILMVLFIYSVWTLGEDIVSEFKSYEPEVSTAYED